MINLTNLIDYDPKLTLGNILEWSIGALFTATLAVLIGERIRKKNEKERREYEVLEDLIASKNDLSSDRFLSALNRVPLVFYNNKEIRGLVRDLHRAITNEEKLEVINDRVIELIFNISKTRKYNLSDSEIRNVFTKSAHASKHSPVKPLSPSEIPGDPSSTVNADDHLTIIKTESISANSITSSEIGN